MNAVRNPQQRLKTKRKKKVSKKMENTKPEPGGTGGGAIGSLDPAQKGKTNSVSLGSKRVNQEKARGGLQNKFCKRLRNRKSGKV